MRSYAFVASIQSSCDQLKQRASHVNCDGSIWIVCQPHTKLLPEYQSLNAKIEIFSFLRNHVFIYELRGAHAWPIKTTTTGQTSRFPECLVLFNKINILRLTRLASIHLACFSFCHSQPFHFSRNDFKFILYTCIGYGMTYRKLHGTVSSLYSIYLLIYRQSRFGIE